MMPRPRLRSVLLFAACLAAAGAAAAPPHPSDEAVRQRLDEILARPEFARREPRVNWLLLVLRAIFAWLAGLHAAAPVLFWFLLTVCAMLLVLLLGYIIWSVARAAAVGHRTRSAEAQAAEKRGRLSLTCREEASRRAEHGDFTEAIRYLFLALVCRFDERGRVNFERAYTNREYLGLFADRPPVHADLKVFVDTLDDRWYGQHLSGRRQYEECLALYDRLERQG
jgi:hypothetical protein